MRIKKIKNNNWGKKKGRKNKGGGGKEVWENGVYVGGGGWTIDGKERGRKGGK